MTALVPIHGSSFFSQQGALRLSLEFSIVYKYLVSLPEILQPHATRNNHLLLFFFPLSRIFPTLANIKLCVSKQVFAFYRWFFKDFLVLVFEGYKVCC